MALAAATELKESDCSMVLTALAEMMQAQIKKTGQVIIPGVTRVVTRAKNATMASKREMFGKIFVVKALPARTVAKAFPVAAFKQAVRAGVASFIFVSGKVCCS